MESVNRLRRFADFLTPPIGRQWDKLLKVRKSLTVFRHAWGMMKLEIESAKVDEDVFNGIVYRKHNGTNYYLTDDEDGLYLVKGSD